MATEIEADVLRLFIDEASFLAGSKRKQMGFDKATKRALLHNDVDDTLAMGWSDDSKQVLLSGTQTITGIKSFGTGPRLLDNISLGLGTDYDGSLIFDGTDVVLETGPSIDLVLNVGDKTTVKSDGATMLEINRLGINVPDDSRINLGTDFGGWLYYDGARVILRDTSSTLTLQGGAGIKLQFDAEDILDIASSGVEIASGKRFSLGNVYQAGDPVTTGYLLVSDYNGVEYEIPAKVH